MADATKDAPGPHALNGKPRLSTAGLAGTTLILILAGLLMAWRQGQALSVSNLRHLAVVVANLMGVRMGAIALVARWLRLSVLYRPWETGLLLSGLIALISGGVFVAPGGLYPAPRIWSYRFKQRLLKEGLTLQQYIGQGGTMLRDQKKSSDGAQTYLKMGSMSRGTFCADPANGGFRPPTR